MNWPQLFIVLQLFLVNCLIESASDQSLPRYLPVSEDDALSTKERFEQIMQSGNPSGMEWKPKLKVDQIDIKAEIAKLNSTYVYQSEWPDSSIKLGAVTAVSFDKDGHVVIFHRVDRIWSQNTFNLNTNVFQEQYRGPIDQNTILALDRKSGKLVYGWGKNIFYMPHGLTIDHEDNVWVTDVALHQVMKFGPRGLSGKPLLTLGTAFTPGKNDTNFCKPTSVAVLPNGDFFVADGYCNARIIKYSANGEKILVWGQHSFSGEQVYNKLPPRNFFAIPHALTLVPEQELVCTADRENGRIQCFSSFNGTFHSQFHSQIVGDRLFSMDYTPADGGQFVVVNGPVGGIGLPEQYNEVRGYIMNFKTKQVIGKFGPNDLQFSNPHDVAVTTDGTEIYVAELDPTRVHKFLHKKVAPSLPMSAAKPTATSIQRSTADEPQLTVIATKVSPGSTALLVVALMLFFAFLTFGMALLISRRRKRGCLPFGVKNRRHAWDFPSKPEGFKLGGLLDHRKRGFEKLDQNASDEEPDVTTNMLNNPQFA
ncbi:peptidyl-alpha-hydroxyglycine alpha-amidating lyase 1 isoform X2 [Eupeodes corollae]|uniref:peptidyl-alpha-hydroxyglycine alpha-amidating lyase 1 isoform X2 n=1 Tax=Eupeodes corollae TaxID=290404 RepID=UPI00248F80A0|nr:peptidyl-alpha-hydroxyglycine alpha-amidating lyase 1 isoform X2 [Eupeodes corollae]